jgi:DedD protein
VLSFLKRKDTSPPAGAVDEAASAQAARTRARRRLIGAAVLVGLGIIGFPLLFETQPRPIAVDIPIEIPSRESAAPLSLPAPKTAATPRAAASVAEPRRAEPPPEPAQTAAPPVAPVTASTATAASAPATGMVASAPKQAAPSAQAVAVPAPPSAPARTAAPIDVARDAQRAQALLDGKPDPATAAPAAAAAPASTVKESRFVVQAGAYTDAAALREARQKVERLGLKTYTQVIETDSGARTRVRVGPFATRDEAEKAAARIKGSGLAVSILSL